MVILNSTPGVKRKYVDEAISTAKSEIVGTAATLTTLGAIETKIGGTTIIGDSITAAISALQTAVGTSGGEDSLASKIEALETTVNDSTSGVGANRTSITALEGTVGDSTKGLVKAVANNTTAITDITKSGGAIDSAITALNLSTTYLGINDNAASASKLTAADAGTATTPVYFSNGVPVALGYTIQTSVPENAVFTDTVTTVTGNDGEGNVITGISATNGQITVTKGTVATASDVSDIKTILDGYTATGASVATTVAAAKKAGDDAQDDIDALETALGTLNSATAIQGAIDAVQGNTTETVASVNIELQGVKTTADGAAGKLADVSSTVGAEITAAQTAAETHADNLVGTGFSTTNTVAAKFDKLFNGNSDSATGTIPDYIKNQVKSQVASTYKAKGSTESLPNNLTSDDVGDVYNLTVAKDGYPVGTNWVWTGSEWDALAGITDLSAYATRAATNEALTAIGTDLGYLESDVSALYGAKAGNPVIGTFSATAQKTGGSASISWGVPGFTAGENDCIIVEFTDPEAAYKSGITVTSVSGSTLNYTMDYEDTSVSGSVVVIPKGDSTTTHTAHTSTIPTGNTIATPTA